MCLRVTSDVSRHHYLWFGKRLVWLRRALDGVRVVVRTGALPVRGERRGIDEIRVNSFYFTFVWSSPDRATASQFFSILNTVIWYGHILLSGSTKQYLKYVVFSSVSYQHGRNRACCRKRLHLQIISNLLSKLFLMKLELVAICIWPNIEGKNASQNKVRKRTK